MTCIANGKFMSAISATPNGSPRSVGVYGNGTDTGILYDVSAVYPSIISFANSSIWVCGEDKYQSRGVSPSNFFHSLKYTSSQFTLLLINFFADCVRILSPGLKFNHSSAK